MNELFDLSEIDLTLLKSQKDELVEMIWSDPDHNLWGVVELQIGRAHV